MKTKFEFADKFGFERKFGFAEFDNESNKELVVNVDYNKLIQFIKQNSGCNHFFKVDNFESKTKQQVLNEKQVQPSTKIDIRGEEVFVDGLLYGNIYVDLSQYKLEFDLQPERSVEHQYFYITYYEYEKDILAIKLRVKSYEYFERLCHYIGVDIGRFKEDVKKKYLTAYDKAKSLKMKYRILKLMPNYVIDSFSSKALEAILLGIARSDIKTVFRDDQEAVYQLLKALSRKSRNSYEFLNILIKPYLGTVILKSIITQFGDFRGDYLTKIIALVYMEWKQSLYSKPFLSVYNNRQNDGPSFLPYYSDKTIGFFHSNFNVSLIGKYVKASYSGDDMIYTLGDGSKKKDEIKANETFKYHPYYPVQIPLEQEGELKLASQVPAFFLYVKENKDFWGNALFGAEIALDVLTVFTGALAVSRFVHLIRLANRAKHLGRGTKAIRFARASAYIRLGGGLIEISAGGLSAFLKLFDVVEDPELKKDLHDLLLIMEIMSISADLPDLIRKTFKKQVGKVAKQRSKIRQAIEDRLITPEEGETILNELKNVTGVNYKIEDFIKRNANKGRTINNIPIKYIIKQLRNTTSTSTEIARLLKRKKIKVIILDEIDFLDAIRQYGEKLDDLKNINAAAIRNKIYVKSDRSLEVAFGEIVHEGVHVKDFLEGLILEKHIHDNLSLKEFQKLKSIVKKSIENIVISYKDTVTKNGVELLDDVNISLKKYVDDYKLTYNQMIEFRARALEWEFQKNALQDTGFDNLEDIILYIITLDEYY